jgi:hypothetical protein
MLNQFLIGRQVKELKDNNWSVNAKGSQITLHAEDFPFKTWEDICDNLQISVDVKKVTILFFGTKTNSKVTLYDDYDKSAGYIIEKENKYWTGKDWSDIKAYAESYKTKKEAEQKTKLINL